MSIVKTWSNSRTPPLQINSQSFPRLDPIDSKSSFIRSVRTQAKIQEVQIGLQGDEQRPFGDRDRNTARRNNFHLKKSSFNNITKKDLKLQCYVPAKGTKMKMNDPQRRVAFARSIVARPLAERELIVTSDEAWFDMNGCVNRQNDRCYAPKKHNGQGGKPDHFR